MDKAHYIIFHPESKRQIIDTKANAIENGQVNTAWEGKIYVDRINNGNEDPFVYTHLWLYSYCHATQLRRNFRKDNNYLQNDSVIFFVSGDCANKENLTIDTVFVIENALKWTKKPKLALPKKYQVINEDSPLFKRHLRFPFCGQHADVTHTYEAKMWNREKAIGEDSFSFLPLDKNGERVTIPFCELPSELEVKISKKVKRKYPVLLNVTDLKILLILIHSRAVTKVVGGLE